MLLAAHFQRKPPSPRWRRAWAALVTWLLAALACGGSAAIGQEPLKQRLIDVAPFDRMTLDKANENKVLVIRPVALPGRVVPEKPKPTEKLRIFILDEAQEYEVAWQNIEKLELYEQMVLAEAGQLVAQGKFDEAYDYFVFLLDHYPNTPGLKQAQQTYLYLSSGAAFRQQKYDEALALVEELLAQNPAYRAAGNSPALLTVLGSIADKVLAGYVEKQEYRTARTLLNRLAKDHQADAEPFVQRWRTQLTEQAAGLRDKARGHLAAKEFVEANDACAEMLEVWPEVTGGAELAAELARLYPLVRVAVEHPALQFDVRSVQNPAARRAGRLVERRLLEFSGPGPEGGQYLCPLGTVEQSDDGLSLIFKLRQATIGELSGYDLAQRLLDWTRPDDPGFQPAWARTLAAVRVSGVSEVTADLKSPHVLAKSLLQVSYQPVASVGAAGVKGNGPFFLLSRDEALARFTANDRYFLVQPGQPAEVVERLYDDPQRAIAALKRGEVDVLDRVFPGDIPALAADPSLAVAPCSVPTTHLVVFKTRHPFLTNRQFRRALAYASNCEQVLSQGILDGKSPPGFRLISGPFPAPTGGQAPAYAYDQEIEPRGYDPRLALTLKIIAQAEVKAAHERLKQQVPALAPFTLGHPADEASRIACRALAKGWKAVGVECKLTEFPPGVFDDEKGGCDATYVQAAIWEPVVDIARLLGPEGIAPTDNAFIQLALRQIEQATNWQDARQRFRQLHRLIHEDVTVLPLWQTMDHYAYRKSLQGLAEPRATLYQTVEQWQVAPRLARAAP
jgi:hypothetical protein